MEVETDNEGAKDLSTNMVKVQAHECILTARRTDYFEALFCKGATTIGGKSLRVTFLESADCTINVEPTFSPPHIRYMPKFIYTNGIQALRLVLTDNLLCILHLSDKWLLRDLQHLIEH
jgi:hypothetical protein